MGGGQPRRKTRMILSDVIRPAVVCAVTATVGIFLSTVALAASDAPSGLLWIVAVAFAGVATVRAQAAGRKHAHERPVADAGGQSGPIASPQARQNPTGGVSRRRRIKQLLEDNATLQAALLPDVPSRIGKLVTTVAYRPADGPAAGGDFYDAFALPDGRVALLLGDVSGHGAQALAKTTLVRFTVRAHLEAGSSPREAIAIAGRSLDGRLSDDFATVIAAIHDPVQGTLTYASAGHPPPIVVGPTRHRPVIVASAPPIGIGFPTGQRQTVLPMPAGTCVLICSDGLLEARIGGIPIGSERLTGWLSELGPDATATAVLDRVIASADATRDDLTACVVHVAAPGASAAAAPIEQIKLDVLDPGRPDLEGFLTAAGVSQAERLIVCRRVSDQLNSTGAAVIEVHTTKHPIVRIVRHRESASRDST
jgi:Stage II sporulation protein E (SpoIIE)